MRTAAPFFLPAAMLLAAAMWLIVAPSIVKLVKAFR